MAARSNERSSMRDNSLGRSFFGRQNVKTFGEDRPCFLTRSLGRKLELADHQTLSDQKQLVRGSVGIDACIHLASSNPIPQQGRPEFQLPFVSIVLMPTHLVVSGPMSRIIDPEPPETVARCPKNVSHRQALQLREWRPFVHFPVFGKLVCGLKRCDQE